MRNCILFFLTSLLLTLCSLAAAQPGFKLGPNISDIVFADNGTSSYLGYEANYLDHRLPYLSVQGGLFWEAALSERLSLQPELLLARRGLKYDTDYLYGNFPYTVKIRYLQAPLLLKYQLLKRANWPAALCAGPYAARKLEALRSRKTGQWADMPNVRPWYFGLILGYAVSFDLPYGHLVAELRSSYSLVNMMDKVEGYIPEYTEAQHERAKNVNVSMMVGYQFKTKKP